MGFFFKNKQAQEPLEITGEQLIALLQCAVKLAIEDVEAKAYTVGPEIMFDYGDDVHFIGVKYDKKSAKKAKLVTFSSDLMSVYIDKDEFNTVEELREYGMLDGKLLKDIDGGILVDQEFKDLL